jgi:hypothetical protein
VAYHYVNLSNSGDLFMKFIALSFIASLVAGLPVVAQPTRPQAPSNRPAQSTPAPQLQRSERIAGAKCLTKVIDAAKKEVQAPCHHLSISGPGGATLSFTFYDEKEEFGVGYVVGKDLKRDDKGRTYYEITGMFVRQNGKAGEVKKAGGICSRDPKLLKNVLSALCMAEISNGTTFSSGIGNK